jgi:hypothetical protein
MKKYGIKYLVLSLLVLSALALAIVSCDSSSSDVPTGTVSITIGGGAQIPFSGASDGVKAFYTEEGSGPIPAASTAIVAINNSDPDLAISFTGTAAGIYTVGSGEAVLSCSDAEGNIYSAFQILAHTSGTVTVTEYGSVGHDIVGSYSITADAYTVGGDPSGSTVLITGEFSITRGNDI